MVNQQQVERTLQKDREELPIHESYDNSLKKLKELKEKVKKSKLVVRGKERSFGKSRQGIVKSYLDTSIEPGVVQENFRMFIHEIRNHSGRHVHQGGLGLFVLDGKGYTVVDGIRYDWEKGDLIMLPLKPGGVEHQHFNLEGKPSRWLCLRSTALEAFTGRFMEQRENQADWKEKEGKT